MKDCVSRQLLAFTFVACAAVGCAAKSDPSSPANTGAAVKPDPAPSTAPPEPANDPATEPVGDCVLRLELDSHASLLEEHRSHAAVDDFHPGIEAAAVAPGFHPALATAALTVSSRPALWFTADYARVVVDETLASALQAVDATRLGAGETKRIGTLTAKAREGLGGRGWVELLLRAHVIGTWIHIGSQLCLSAERESEADGYRVAVDGEHTYFTNEENVEPIHFDVAIASDGAVTVIGR